LAIPEQRTHESFVDRDAITRPIPDLSELRAKKDGYRDWPINPQTPYFNEELINIAQRGLAGQAYYSRHNQTTKQPVAGVPEDVYLRLTLASKLLDIDDYLNDPFFNHLFGGQVELYAEDGLRTRRLQKYLHDTVFPDLIKAKQPDIDELGLKRKLQQLIAEPDKPGQPSPHATGGAVDVILRYKQGIRGHSRDARVLMGYEEGELSERCYPDYFELNPPKKLEEEVARAHRQVFYAIMTGAAFGTETGLQVNPTEWWHWSWGDQMWAKLKGEPAALYGAVEESDELRG
jgi:D-alanyl-D-alanine dipeptidase